MRGRTGSLLLANQTTLGTGLWKLPMQPSLERTALPSVRSGMTRFTVSMAYKAACLKQVNLFVCVCVSK